MRTIIGCVIARCYKWPRCFCSLSHGVNDKPHDWSVSYHWLIKQITGLSQQNMMNFQKYFTVSIHDCSSAFISHIRDCGIGRSKFSKLRYYTWSDLGGDSVERNQSCLLSYRCLWFCLFIDIV